MGSASSVLPSSIASQVAARASSDVSLILRSIQPLPRAIATAALATCLLTGTVAGAPSPALADFPETAPSTYFYDESNLVNKSSSSLFTKALSKIKERTGFNVKVALVRSIPYGSSPQEYAEQLFRDWNLGGKDVVIVAGVKIARAGLAAGEDAAKYIPSSVAESICNETYAFKAGDEAYSSAILDVSNRLVPLLNGGKWCSSSLSSVHDLTESFVRVSNK